MNKSFCERYWKQIWLKKGHRKKPLISSFTPFDIDKLLKMEEIKPPILLDYKKDKLFFNLAITKETLTATVEGYKPQVLQIETVPCHFGGERHFIKCSCGKRHKILYLYHGFLFCRKCLGLQYESQSLGSLLTFYKRQDKVKAAMKKKDPNWDGYRRPKGMHETTYRKLMDLHYEAEEKHFQKLDLQFDGMSIYG